jgi:hypothetical protein
MRSSFSRSDITAALPGQAGAGEPVRRSDRRTSPPDAARRHARMHRVPAAFSILHFVFVGGAAALALSFLAVVALKVAGAGGFADASRFSITLGCLFLGLGFSSWFFEECEVRR